MRHLTESIRGIAQGRGTAEGAGLPRLQIEMQELVERAAHIGVEGFAVGKAAPAIERERGLKGRPAPGLQAEPQAARDAVHVSLDRPAAQTSEHASRMPAAVISPSLLELRRTSRSSGLRWLRFRSHSRNQAKWKSPWVRFASTTFLRRTVLATSAVI